jgi:hypothetical protein
LKSIAGTHWYTLPRCDCAPLLWDQVRRMVKDGKKKGFFR